MLARLRRYQRSCVPTSMFEPDDIGEPKAADLEQIYRRAPAGALAVAGIATALVFTLWFAFYLAIFLPRGVLQ